MATESSRAPDRRSVALDPETVKALKRQAAQQLASQVERGDEWSESGLVFTDEAGEAWHPDVTIAITLDTYSHAIPAMQEEAAALIAGLVFGSTA